MSDKEILGKAIQKAIDGGWTDDVLEDVGIEIYSSSFGDYRSMNDLIYRHDFAKALWGEGHYNLIVAKGRKAFGSKQVLEDVTGEPVLEAWQYHLQNMVISPDPIKYLGQNIPNEREIWDENTELITINWETKS